MIAPRRLLLSALLLPTLAACAPAAQTGAAELPRGPVQQLPVRQSAADFQRDLAPHRGQIEWWYVSSSLPQSGLALHWALFKIEALGHRIYISHVAVTDLKRNTLKFSETSSQAGAGVSFPPLVTRQAGQLFSEQLGADGTPAGFTLKTPELDIALTPLKPAVRHPASGTPQSGQLEYQSDTRMRLTGTVSGQAVDGTGWFDHQWGDQLPGQSAFWDWMGLQLSDGSDLMIYRVRDASGEVLQTYGTRVAPDGTPSALPGLTLTPTREWVSAAGRRYNLGWRVTGENGLNLTADAARDSQEIDSKGSGVTYWEGPMTVSGALGGQAVTGSGMGEFLSAQAGNALSDPASGTPATRLPATRTP